MDCRHCGSEETVRNGRHAGVQRFLCRSCGRYFRETEPKFGKAVEARALDMYLNNVGIRKIARFTGASPAGVLKWIRKAHKALAEQLAQAASQVEEQMPDIIEMDEIYTYVQKNTAAPSYGLLIAGDSVALLRITSAITASPAP
jgi:transposase-like protein